jgi:RNA polymerase sigma-70 factor, ECF subfamily
VLQEGPPAVDTLNMTDRRQSFDEVLGSARRGSPWAFGWLYRRFQPGLLRMLAVIAPHHAEDIAADVWLEVAATLPAFEGDERAFRAWLASTARYQVIEATRRNGRRVGRVLDDDATESMASTSFAARVVAVLPPEEADVVLLRVVKGMDVEEVAKALGRPPAAVRSLQHRALRRLARAAQPAALTA